jgi:hypothetical protein
MLRAIQPKGTHRHAGYMIEAFLWAKSVASRSDWTKMPSMRTLARYRDLEPANTGFFLEAARVIEDCYDDDASIELRLRRLGDVLTRVRELVTVDKELLVWAAATRWLARINFFPVAALALGEYEALSMRLSHWQHPDVLGIVSDMRRRRWYADGAKAEELKPAV